MATTEEAGKALQNTGALKPSATVGIEALLSKPGIKKRFEEMLGRKAAGFMSSVISAWSTNSYLRKCDPSTVVAAAAMAATLDLPINSNLGFAAIVPYKDKAQFQVMAKGFIQLGIRSGQYRKMNSSEVYSDEIESYNAITGEFKFTDPKTWKIRYEAGTTPAKSVGYVAFFETVNGFEKWLYMTKEQCLAHGKKFSQSFQGGRGPWVDNPHAMCLKTVIKLLLSKWGILSIEMQKAIVSDQAVVNDEGDPVEFPDAVNADIVENAPAVTADPVKPEFVAKSETETHLDKNGKPIEL